MIAPEEAIERARRLAAQGRRAILGIAGAPGAGKSTLAAAVAAALGDRARMRARALLDEDPALQAPEHVLIEEAVRAAYGADALEPIPA